MKISGFTFIRNATKLYYPVKESIASVLPFVDEFIVALGAGDPDDRTREEIESLQSDKIIIYDRVWDEKAFTGGHIFRDETNFALSKCTGDWCFYIQGDEAFLESDGDKVVRFCEENLERKEVDGLLFKYRHFWGDYDHQIISHGAYKNEIRLVRNSSNIQSVGDAQSFRKEGEKLNVIAGDVHIHHYGWVRPPELMQNKKKTFFSFYWGKKKADKQFENSKLNFDYGPLGRMRLYTGSHPVSMTERILEISWKDQLNYSKKWTPNRPLMKHEKIKYRILSFIENNFMNEREIFGYSNWRVIR
jgi:hypothetical protein